MKQALLMALALAAASTASHAESCEELKASIDAKIRAGGVNSFSLAIVDAAAGAPGRTVGTCGLGKQRIVYTLAAGGSAAAQAAAQPASAAAAAQPSDPTAAKSAKEPGAVVTESGLVYRSLQDGKGDSPKATDVVKVHYKGTFPDGKEFDSSYSRGKPLEFPLNRVIKCWTEGVQRMQIGGKAKLTCPPAIAYGERGAGGVIPPNATLLFEVELLGITKN